MRSRRARSALIAAFVGAMLLGGLVAAPASAAPSAASRIAGDDRYATAAAVSAATVAAGPPVAYVASGAAFPDALSASAAAGSQGAPVLLTAPGSLPKATAAELTRLRPGRIVVLGGEVAVAPRVVDALGAFTAGAVTRLAGEDRYATAVEVSRSAARTGGTVFLASGEDFPDALSGAALAARLGAPVLLTPSRVLPAGVAREITRLTPSRLVVLGGDQVVTPAVLRAAEKAAGRAAERLAGADRYATSAAIAAEYAASASVVHLASGATFPDALAGAAAAGAAAAPLLLVRPGDVPGVIGTQLTRLRPARLVVLGGPVAVAESAFAHARDFAAAHAAAAGGVLTTETQLAAGACLASPDGGHRLCLTAAGELRVQRGSAVLWTSGARGTDAASLRLRPNGELVVFARDGRILWRSSTVDTDASRLVVQDDGDVELQNATGAIRWSTMTSPDAPVWGLPYEAGQNWAAGGPHTSLGTNSGARGSIDFGPSTAAAGTKGTRVVTIAPGDVYAFTCGGGKRYLGVQHADGWQSTYYHLTNEQWHLLGKTVPAGTYLGDVAQTLPCGGGSTFAHVHLTIRRAGQPVSVEGMRFGGYTVRSSGSDFSGTWHDAAGKTVLTATRGATCCLQAKETK